MLKIAIVDDHLLFRKSLALLVATFDNVELVFDGANGREFLDYLEDHTVDLVMLDIEMPLMNGYDTCRELQQHYPEVMILIISQYTTRESIYEIMNLGAQGYFTKSSDPAQLESAIKSMSEKGFYFGMELGPVIREALLWDKKAAKTASSEVVLTARELEIIKLASRGLGIAEIAAKMFVSPRTVETQRNRMMTKTGSRNFIGSVLYALKTKQLTIDEIEGT